MRVKFFIFKLIKLYIFACMTNDVISIKIFKSVRQKSKRDVETVPNILTR